MDLIYNDNFIDGVGSANILKSSFCLAGTSAAIVKVLLHLCTDACMLVSTLVYSSGTKTT